MGIANGTGFVIGEEEMTEVVVRVNLRVCWKKTGERRVERHCGVEIGVNLMLGSEVLLGVERGETVEMEEIVVEIGPTFLLRPHRERVEIWRRLLRGVEEIFRWCCFGCEWARRGFVILELCI